MTYTLSPIKIVEATSATPYIQIQDNASSNIIHSISKSNIQNVSFTYSANPGSAYGYPTMTILSIDMVGSDNDFKVELQNVTNKATWNTGTQAAAQQAVNDILTSL